MGIFNIFKSDEEGIRRSHIKNLISIAMADGHLDEGEWDLLVIISRIIGITEDEIAHIRSYPDHIKFIPPKRYEDKVQQIQDLVAVMTIDGEINSRELELCKKISLRLDLLPQLVDQIIADQLQADKPSTRS
jgi:uncharacterized tellurite resistance protein B-like protein